MAGIKKGQNKYMSSAFKLVVRMKILIQRASFTRGSVEVIGYKQLFPLLSFSFITTIVLALFKIILISQDVRG